MAYIGNPIYQSAFVTDTFSGNGSTTAFTMSVAPAGVSNVLIAISGVLQDPATYGVVGNTLNFSQAPPTGTNNISCRYLGVPATGVTTTAYRTQTEFTATAGQTTFTPPSYTVGFIDVYRNGALLGSADFTATNGTTVVLTNAASEGDLIETVSFLVSSVLNAIPGTTGSVGTTYLADAGVTQTKLAAGVAGTGPAFSVSMSGQQSISAATVTKIAFDVEDFDTNNNFNTANFRFTPTVAGYYQFNLNIYAANGTMSNTNLNFYKNGAAYTQPVYVASGFIMQSCSALIFLNGSTDYVETYFNNQNACFINSGQTAPTFCRFSGSLVRSA
jgi:hypothetical protein